MLQLWLLWARLKNMGVNLYASDDANAPENSVIAKTATEALQFFEGGQKNIRIEAVNSEPEWDAMMRYAAENDIQLCCTGGVKLGNIHEFSAPKAVIGVGASSILTTAREYDGDLDEGVAVAIVEMSDAWDYGNVSPELKPSSVPPASEQANE